MKKKKGFTLIELLAIIVILAIIAVITVPIILNIIENATMGAAKDSAYGYKDAINKYYLKQLSEDSSFMMANKTYTIDSNTGYLKYTDSENSENNITYELSISGQIPNGGAVELENNKIKQACIQFSDYAVTITDNEIGEATKETCSGTIILPPSISFAEDSWATIKANLTANRNAYDIGDTKEVVIDNVSYTVRLANTSSCPDNWPEAASQTACGVVIEFIDTIKNGNNDGYFINSSNTNAGGWPSSSMRSFLNTTIFNKLPEELKSNGMIIDTSVVSGHGSASGEINFTSTDKLYLLSIVEILGSNYDEDTLKLVSDTVTDGTRMLEYYGKAGSTRIKKTPDGSTIPYWLRSPNLGSSNRYYYVTAGGAIYTEDPYYTSGVAAAFRILD